MGRRNVILADNSREEMEGYRQGLEEETGFLWETAVCRANEGRTGFWRNGLRYVKYFLFSFSIFLRRRKYGCIVGWQAFYGLCFAFWCRVFRVKKRNFLMVKNLTYREKKGIIGKIYFIFMRFVIKSGYVDLFTCCSKDHCGYCAEMFGEPPERFRFVPFGVEDVRDRVEKKAQSGEFVLSVGRSNRDWDFLINALGGTEYSVRIVCDELKREDIPENIRIFKDVWGEKTLEFFRDCRVVVIPILDGRVAAGETVLLQAMCFGKPVIVARPGGKWEEYITCGETGFVVEKEGDSLRDALELLKKEEIYSDISRNCRQSYEEQFSLSGYGRRIGRIVKEAGHGCAGDGGDPGIWGGKVFGCLRCQCGGAELQESGNSAH